MNLKERGFTVGDLVILIFLSIFVFLIVKIKDSKNKQVDNSSIIIFSDIFKSEKENNFLNL